jgi:serine/threonine protein kinase
MVKEQNSQDQYIGLQTMQNYFITEKIDKGKIGVVYKAVNQNLHDTLACKIIPTEKLKKGWERELEKVLLLRRVPNVVQYHQHGTGLDNTQKPFVWIMWDYIPSINLKNYIKTPLWPLDMAFIENIARTTLAVLHACHSVGIQHGDLHEGNILISEPDMRLPG